MNERFRELGKQARAYAREYVEECKRYGHYMEHNEFDLRFEQKFAELLIKECAKAAREFVITENNKLVEKVYISPWELQVAIEDHFGIEQ